MELPPLTPHRVQPKNSILNGGRYELSEFVSKGGMGLVYRAEDADLNRSVAIKCLLEIGKSEAKNLAITEARTLAALEHPNIMRVYDILNEGDQVWIVSEWLKGKPLSQTPKPLSTPAVLAIMQQIFDGLAAAHAASVFHRDIKPENIMLAETGRLTIIDFGVAYAPGISSGETVAGSLRYSDPRILEGRHPDAWSDLFSTALVAIELLTGEVVLPNLAPLPLYRHMKKHLHNRVEILVDGVYPPLRKILLDTIFSERDPTRLNPAKDLYHRVSEIYEDFSHLPPDKLLESYLAAPDTQDSSSLKKIKPKVAAILNDSQISGRDKAAWVAYQTLHIGDVTPSAEEATKWQVERRYAGTSLTKFLSLCFGIFVLILFPLSLLLTEQHTDLIERLPTLTKTPYKAPGVPLVMKPLVFAPVDHSASTPEREGPSPSKQNTDSQTVTPKEPPAPSVDITKLAAPSVINPLTLKTPAIVVPIEGPVKADALPTTIPVAIVANTWANIFVDGRPMGRLPAAKPFGLAPGSHRIKLHNPYFNTLEEQVTISESSSTQPLRFSLTPMQREFTFIFASPRDLKVDGEAFANVTKKSMMLTYGEHTLEFLDQSGQPQVRTIKIAPDSPVEIDLSSPQKEAP